MKGTTRRKRKLIRISVTVAVALSVVAAPHAGNATVCDDSGPVNTLHLTVEAKKRAVAPGGTIKLLVAVERGLEDYDQPRVAASGVDAIALLGSGWPPLSGGSTTGDDGTTVIKIKVPKKAPRGWLDGYAVAQKEYGPRICGDITSERGFWRGERIVKIRS